MASLLIVAPNEREVRIEVGYGLEGTLTDAISSSIIQTVHPAAVPRRTLRGRHRRRRRRDPRRARAGPIKPSDGSRRRRRQRLVVTLASARCFRSCPSAYGS